MPSRNTARIDLPDTYYHAYARGANKAAIFLESADKDYFLYLLSRHLSVEPVVSKAGYPYPHFRDKIELLAYCLMGNHFHMLLFQHDQGALTGMMRSVMTAYTAYFNRKYKRSGPLFESRFKSAHVSTEAHLQHVSRYIHLNPRSWKRFPYSSLIHIRNKTEPEWLQTAKVLEDYDSRRGYMEFVADYEDSKLVLDSIKHELANL